MTTKLETTNAVFTVKIKTGEHLPDGKAIFQKFEVDFTKMHPTWVEAYLRKAAQRWANDKFSALKGKEKLDAVKLELDENMSGRPVAERERRGPSASGGDPIVALAMRNAKSDLMAVFKTRTGAAKIADIIASGDGSVTKYFTPDGTWKDTEVEAFITRNADSGKRDYVADATATLNADI